MIKYSLYFEPRDLWIGVYWDKEEHPFEDILNIYICVIPTICFHIQHLKDILDD